LIKFNVFALTDISSRFTFSLIVSFSWSSAHLAAAANLTRDGFYPIFLEKPRIPFQAKGEAHGLPGGPGGDG
jgi:hypothetical protein